MTKITLHVRVMSCKGLKAFNFFQKLLVYALVSVLISSHGGDKEEEEEEEEEVQQQKHRTQRDEEGDGDPEWNQEMQFDVDEDLYRKHSDRLLIHFELRHEGIMFGDKVIGEVHVPLKDLIEDEFSSDGVARFVSYEVRSTDGKPNGVLNFSYRLLNGIPKVQPLPCTSSYSASNNFSGYPTSPTVQYPSMEEEEVDVEPEPLAVPPQQVPHSWLTQYHYPPPPPPPPPVAHGEYYYPLPPPPPPQVHYWPPQQHVGRQDTWSSSSGEPHALKEGMWPTSSGDQHWSPFWNGR